MNADDRRLDWVLGGAMAALLILPWYKIRGGFFGLGWITDFFTKPDLWPAAVQAVCTVGLPGFSEKVFSSLSNILLSTAT